MISAPFELLSLPNLPSKSRDEKPFAVGDKNVYLGVSHSSINALALRPPRLLNAYAVPPSTIVTALVPREDSNKETQVFYATQDRNKFYLKVVGGSESQQVAEEVAAVYYASDLVVAVYRSSSVEAFDPETLQGRWSSRKESGHELVYSAMIDEIISVLVIKNSQGVLVQTVAFDVGGAQVLSSKQLVLENKKDIGKFSYSDGVLFRCTDKSRTVYLYDLPSVELRTSFELQGESGPNGLLALPNKNLLVLQSDWLTLVDCTFQSKLSEIQLQTSNVQLLGYSVSASCAIASLGREIVGLTVSPSAGTLLESIGHGVAVPDKTLEYGFAEVLSADDVDPQQNLASAQAEAQAVLEQFTGYASKKDGKNFSKIVAYLRGTSLAESQPTDDLHSYSKDDRQVDKDLLQGIALLAITPTKGPRKFVPTSVGYYLLSHPLFPANSYNNLFGLLAKVAKLHQQALSALPGASACDVVSGLLSTEDDVFNAAVARLVSEFGYQQILAAFQADFGADLQGGGLAAVVDRLSSHPDAWPVIAPLVDSIGLLAWDKPLLEKLEKRLESQIAETRDASRTNQIISEMLRSIDLDLEAGQTYSNSEIKRKSKKSVQDAAERKETKQPPRYSVETLVFN